MHCLVRPLSILMLLLSLPSLRSLLLPSRAVPRPLFLSSLPLSTRYTIEEPSGASLEAEEAKLRKQLSRVRSSKATHAHYQSLHLPVHTRAAFGEFQSFLSSSPASSLIIDAGCGTGRSSHILASRHPSSLVVGIDRSLPRLTQTHHAFDASSCLHSPEPNLLLLRADLEAFYHLLSLTPPPLPVHHHYFLYPNPFPPTRQLHRRLYARPMLGEMAGLGGGITVRTNWRHYLGHFQDAVKGEDEGRGEERGEVRLGRVGGEESGEGREGAIGVGVTNFERKYLDVGEECWELRMGEARVL